MEDKNHNFFVHDICSVGINRDDYRNAEMEYEGHSDIRA